MQEFKVGDLVDVNETNLKKEFFGTACVIEEIYGKSNIAKIRNTLTGETLDIFLRWLDKSRWVEVNESPQEEPFELKDGMKVKLKTKKEPILLSLEERHSVFDKDKNFLEYFYKSKCGWRFYDKSVDWEATRKLNEVKEEQKDHFTTPKVEDIKDCITITKAYYPKLYAVAVNKPIVKIKIMKNRNFYTKNKVFIALEEFKSCGQTIKVGVMQDLSDDTIFKDEDKGFYEYKNIIFLDDLSRTEEEILATFDNISKNIVLPNMRAEEMSDKDSLMAPEQIGKWNETDSKKSFYVVYKEPSAKRHLSYEEALEEAKSKLLRSPNDKVCIMKCEAELSASVEVSVKNLK